MTAYYNPQPILIRFLMNIEVFSDHRCLAWLDSLPEGILCIMYVVVTYRVGTYNLFESDMHALSPWNFGP